MDDRFPGDGHRQHAGQRRKGRDPGLVDEPDDCDCDYVEQFGQLHGEWRPDIVGDPADARVRADGCGDCGCGYQRSMRVLWPGKADTLVELR